MTDKIAVFRVEIGKMRLADFRGQYVSRISMCEYTVRAVSASFEYNADMSKDVMVLRIPMRYVTLVNEIGDEDANKD